MKLMVCIEMRNGILFNHRRVSQDRVVTEDILKECEGNLWIGTYSESLFQDFEQGGIQVNDAYLSKAKTSDWCFVETAFTEQTAEQADEIIVYQWNRRYPADVFLTWSMDGWIVESQTELAGFSHEKITKTHYRRK